MAVTKIIPIRCSIEKSIKYICTPNKTEEMLYVHSENCFPQTASVEFDFYLKKARDGANTIGRHLIQSFAPNEVTPEQAHEIGKKLADEILKGEYAYVMTTHVDKDHIHNHFVWCAVNIKTHKRYQSNKKSYRKIQKVSDKLCEQYGLSVIKKESCLGSKNYYEYKQFQKGNSYKNNLKNAIDECIKKAKDYDEFLLLMESLGYEIKRGKHISFRHHTQQRFTRAKTIGIYYTEDKIIDRLTKINYYKNKSGYIDINKGKFLDNIGLKYWAMRENLHTTVNTVNSLTEKGLLNSKELALYIRSQEKELAEKMIIEYDANENIQELEQLKLHLSIYSKTKKYNNEFEKQEDKEKFLRANPKYEREIMGYKRSLDFIVNCCAKNGFTDTISIDNIDNKINDLKEQIQESKSEQVIIKDELKELRTLQNNLNEILNTSTISVEEYGKNLLEREKEKEQPKEKLKVRIHEKKKDEPKDKPKDKTKDKTKGRESLLGKINDNKEEVKKQNKNKGRGYDYR